MERLSPIEYHLTRDFSRKMNATFEFIRQNFKSLAKSILAIAGPPVLVASMMIGSFMGDFLNLSRSAAADPGNAEMFANYFMSVTFWIEMLLMTVFFVVGSVMTIATINNYIILYGEKKTNDITVAEVWERVRSSFWMYFGTMFFFFLMGIGVYIVLIIPVALLAAISPALIILGIMLLFCGVVYLIVSVSLTFIVRAYERKGFFEAIGRSFWLVREKWWSTFGLVMVLYFIMLVVSYIFIIPWYIVTTVSALHSTSTDSLQESMPMWNLLTTVFFTLYYASQMVLASLPNVGIAFQYFNLVEMKEAKGLLNKIDTIGLAPPPGESEEQY